VTLWANFGGGHVVGRGKMGIVNMTIGSTTRRNPEAMRIVVGGLDIKTDLSWSIRCWNEFNDRYRSAEVSGISRRPPVTVNLPSWVANFDFCALYLSAGRDTGGALSVKMQARYA
jgi:hypothetical protein